MRAAVHLVALIYSGCLNSFNHLTPLTSIHRKKYWHRAAAALQIFSSRLFPLLSSVHVLPAGAPYREGPVKLHMAE